MLDSLLMVFNEDPKLLDAKMVLQLALEYFVQGEYLGLDIKSNSNEKSMNMDVLR